MSLPFGHQTANHKWLRTDGEPQPYAGIAFWSNLHRSVPTRSQRGETHREPFLGSWFSRSSPKAPTVGLMIWCRHACRCRIQHRQAVLYRGATCWCRVQVATSKSGTGICQLRKLHCDDVEAALSTWVRLLAYAPIIKVKG